MKSTVSKINLAVLTAQLIAALATDAEDLDLFAFLQKRLDEQAWRGARYWC